MSLCEPDSLLQWLVYWASLVCQVAILSQLIIVWWYQDWRMEFRSLSSDSSLVASLSKASLSLKGDAVKV